MPKIVGLITKVDSTPPQPPSVDRTTTVHFVGGRSGRLSGDRHQPYQQTLERLHAESLPAYVDVDETSTITGVHIPLVVKVRDWNLTPEGNVDVLLQPSHKPHFLQKDNADFPALFAAVKAAKDQNQLVAVTEKPRSREIIDVTPASVPLFDLEQSLDVVGADVMRAEIPPDLQTSVSVVTAAKAASLFASLAGLHCMPNHMASPCIPFSYPDDGCHARAHRMCEVLLKEHGIRAGKIWLFGDPFPQPATLKPRTRNNPDCEVLWRYHVAPFLQVQEPDGVVVRVIDPALFANPVSKEQWRDVQNDPHARFDFTDTAIYDRPESGRIFRDSDFSSTPRDLAPYRRLLEVRMRDEGDPPYCR